MGEGHLHKYGVLRQATLIEGASESQYQIIYRTDRKERYELLKWLTREWEYADKKFDDQRHLHDQHMVAEGISDDGWWFNQVFQYVKRAEVLSLSGLRGRQAIFKCFAALSGLLESVIRTQGLPPDAGHPSGYIYMHGEEVQ